ncbi:MAG: hypothetical protein R3A44_08705 [Caldilineaceae bacterium]
MKLRQAIIRILEQQISRLRRDRNRVAALQSAHTIIAHRHPVWVESGFTKRFLLHDAASLVEPYLQGGAMPKAQALAETWAAIYPFADDGKERAVAQILPIMVDFIYVLHGEQRYFARLNPQPQVTKSSPRMEPAQR